MKIDKLGKRILIVDDDPDIAEAVKIILEMNNFLVTVDDGTAVEKKVADYNPDLILLDILLAGRDGREICKNLKAIKQYNDLPVILISAHADAAASYEQYKANDFIAKPFEIDELVNKVNDLL